MPHRGRAALTLFALLTLTAPMANPVDGVGPHVAVAAVVSSPYGGTPITVPGTVLAERYDRGGDGVAYHDTTPGNAGGTLRGDDVDLEPSSSGAFDVGWTAAGEWLNYSVDVTASGSSSPQATTNSTASGTASRPRMFTRQETLNETAASRRVTWCATTPGS